MEDFQKEDKVDKDLKRSINATAFTKTVFNIDGREIIGRFLASYDIPNGIDETEHFRRYKDFPGIYERFSEKLYSYITYYGDEFQVNSIHTNYHFNLRNFVKAPPNFRDCNFSIVSPVVFDVEKLRSELRDIYERLVSRCCFNEKINKYIRNAIESPDLIKNGPGSIKIDLMEEGMMLMNSQERGFFSQFSGAADKILKCLNWRFWENNPNILTYSSIENKLDKSNISLNDVWNNIQTIYNIDIFKDTLSGREIVERAQKYNKLFVSEEYTEEELNSEYILFNESLFRYIHNVFPGATNVIPLSYDTDEDENFEYGDFYPALLGVCSCSDNLIPMDLCENKFHEYHLNEEETLVVQPKRFEIKSWDYDQILEDYPSIKFETYENPLLREELINIIRLGNFTSFIYIMTNDFYENNIINRVLIERNEVIFEDNLNFEFMKETGGYPLRTCCQFN